jgi:DNA repair protein RecO (recombination protein O)
MKQVLLQPAYVLHRRSYRESSFLIELWTPDHGRLTVVAHGARKARSMMQGLLQPFIPLLVSWLGKGDLMTLTHSEMREGIKISPLQGECLFAGFYLNELLMCLLQKWDAHATLFKAYEKTVIALQTAKLEQKILRSFEKCLLEELGYGVLPKSEAALQQAFDLDKYYCFIPEQGFVLSEPGDLLASKALFSGKSLVAIAKEDWQYEDSVQDAKRLMRLLLALLLGARPLHSRRLFRVSHSS